MSPGPWPPPKRQILLERNSLAFLGVAIGDVIDIELNSKQYKLQVAGTAYNPDEFEYPKLQPTDPSVADRAARLTVREVLAYA